MANKSGQKFALPKGSSLVAEMFTTQEQRDESNLEKVLDLPLSEIDPFPDHPFNVKMDEPMQAMADSVKAVGIQTPAVLRHKKDGRYELVSSHRRKMACELAGLETMPCIIRELDDDSAVIAMVDANLQREVILPSEKARSYKMRLEAMKRQAGRPKNNLTPVVSDFKELRTNEKLADAVGESREQIRRFIRLTELTPQMLDMVDDGSLPMRPAVELSYLSQEQQQLLQDVIELEDRAPSHAEAAKIRELSNDGQLDEAAIISIMREEKSHKQAHFKLSTEKFRRFFPAGTSIKTIELTIIKALELWESKNQ